MVIIAVRSSPVGGQAPSTTEGLVPSSAPLGCVGQEHTSWAPGAPSLGICHLHLGASCRAPQSPAGFGFSRQPPLSCGAPLSPPRPPRCPSARRAPGGPEAPPDRAPRPGTQPCRDRALSGQSPVGTQPRRLSAPYPSPRRRPLSPCASAAAPRRAGGETGAAAASSSSLSRRRLLDGGRVEAADLRPAGAGRRGPPRPALPAAAAGGRGGAPPGQAAGRGAPGCASPGAGRGLGGSRPAPSPPRCRLWGTGALQGLGLPAGGGCWLPGSCGGGGGREGKEGKGREGKERRARPGSAGAAGEAVRAARGDPAGFSARHSWNTAALGRHASAGDLGNVCHHTG